MTTAEAFAPAKVNLALHVVGQRDDGYHLLESLVVFANLGDRLRAEPADAPSLSVTGPMAAGVPSDASNLVLKAAELAGCTAAFTLEKHLPGAAGLGGGSSDAAAALRLTEALGAVAVSPEAQLSLGADVPVCAYGRACVMRGVGEKITPLQSLPGLAAVLVNPRIDVPTPQVFRALEQKENAPLPPVPEGAGFEAFISYLSAMTRNDLEPPAQTLQSEIAEVLDHLAALQGARLVRMSGSGASCFALFSDMAEAEAGAAQMRAQQPQWWVEAAWLA